MNHSEENYPDNQYLGNTNLGGGKVVINAGNKRIYLPVSVLAKNSNDLSCNKEPETSYR